jgi:hypothetical protein
MPPNIITCCMKKTPHHLFVALSGSAMITTSSAATLIDDFSGDLSAYSSTVILDAGGIGSNASAWQIASGGLQINTSAYDGIEQTAFIYNGLTLDVGQELQVSLTHNGGFTYLGLYVGGSAPVTGSRAHYLNVYANTATNVSSRGFTDVVGGTHEMNLKNGTGNYVSLFIARDAIHDYEAGFYLGDGSRVVIADRNGLTDIDASHVGFYADVRGAGVLGTFDNLRVIPEPASPLLGALGVLALLRRRRG